MRQLASQTRKELEPAAGRLCPLDYCYDPAVFARSPELAADVLYVVGGLYGNAAALDAVERVVQAEAGAVTVFNGDFHWFDAEAGWFAEIEERVARHRAMRGNVETEIARPLDVGAGCGCAYPESVGDDVVHRSNEILRELRVTAGKAGAAERLAALPMHLVAAVGEWRVGIVHGDAAALAGWRFDRPALDDPASRSWLAGVGASARVDVFASTHTGSAALRRFDLPGGSLTVINNGAAGLANFAGAPFGLISRIATRPSPHPPIYGIRHAGLFIDALAVRYETAAFLDRFLARWPPGSPAHAYFQRMIEGPDEIAAARPLR